MRESKYSSMVRWNLSSSLRLTGTIVHQFRLARRNNLNEVVRDEPLRKFPTSSMVRNDDLEDAFLYSVNPPSHAQSSM